VYRRPLPLKEAAFVLGIPPEDVLRLTRERAPASPRGGPPRRYGTGGPLLDHGEHPTRLRLVVVGGEHARRSRAFRLAEDPRFSQRTVHRERRRLALMKLDGAHPSTSLPRAAQALGLPATPHSATVVNNMLAPSAGVLGEDKLRRGYRPDGDTFDAPGVDIESLRWVWEARRRKARDGSAALPPVWPRQERGFRVWHQDPIHPDDLPLRL
jgi:hypothetical protein